MKKLSIAAKQKNVFQDNVLFDQAFNDLIFVADVLEIPDRSRSILSLALHRSRLRRFIIIYR